MNFLANLQFNFVGVSGLLASLNWHVVSCLFHFKIHENSSEVADHVLLPEAGNRLLFQSTWSELFLDQVQTVQVQMMKSDL